jgi:hypothetical protein
MRWRHHSRSRPGCLGLALFPTPPCAIAAWGVMRSIEHEAIRIANWLDLRRGRSRSGRRRRAGAAAGGHAGRSSRLASRRDSSAAVRRAATASRSIAFARSCKARRSGAARRNRCRRSLRNSSQRVARRTRTSASGPRRRNPRRLRYPQLLRKLRPHSPRLPRHHPPRTDARSVSTESSWPGSTRPSRSSQGTAVPYDRDPGSSPAMTGDMFVVAANLATLRR